MSLLSGLGGADAASNPYRLLVAGADGRFLAAAAALGTVAVFSQGDAASPGVATDSQAALGAAPAGMTSTINGNGSGSGSRVRITGQGSEEPSLILSLAWLGGGPVMEGAQQQQGTLVVLQQPPGAPPALSVLQWQRVPGELAYHHGRFVG